MEEWPASASEPIPSKTPKEKQPCYPPPGQTNPGLHLEFLLPFKIPSFMKHRQVQHNHPGIPKAEKQSKSLPSCLNLPAHNSICTGGIQLLSQSCPPPADLHLPLLCSYPSVGRSVTCSFTTTSGNFLLWPFPHSFLVILSDLSLSITCREYFSNKIRHY